MKLNEIKEVGFYRKVNDLERKTIFEVLENTDKIWLKEDPEATLLIDIWLYDYKDENDRIIYFTNGNLPPVYSYDAIEVVKIDDVSYKVIGKYGESLIVDKPTYKEQLEKSEARVKELERKLEIAKKFLIEMVKGEKLFTDKDYLFRAKLALQKMEELN